MGSALETLAADLRFAARTLRKNPGFCLVATFSLALGIGANTAVFSLIDALLLRMLPVAHPEELVFVNTNAVQMGSIQVSRNISNFALKQMQERATRVSGMAAYQIKPKLSVGVNGRAELASGHFVSGSYFSVLGVGAILGRTINSTDDRADGRVALISYGYWERRFGRDRGVLGKDITINNVPFTIVGVTPRDFYGLSADTQAELMLPAATMIETDAGRVSADVPKPDVSAGTVFARIKNSFTSGDSAVELSMILRQAMLAEAGDHPKPEQIASISKLRVEQTPASQGISRARNRFSKPLQILMLVAGLVMLIACANIANLLIARSSSRQREIAIRLSLGSSRWRLIRQLLTESLLLSVLGAILGTFLAVWARDGIVLLAGSRQGVPAIPLVWDFRVLGFTAGVCFLSAMLFGTAPALRATGIDFASMLKSSRTGRAAGRITLGRVLVAGQVGLSLALMICAALFLNTFRNLDRIELGFARDHTLLLTFDPSLAGYRGVRAAEVYRQALDRVAAIPGVRSVSLMQQKPLSGEVLMNSIWAPGYIPKAGEDPANLWVIANGVGPRFFAVSGMRLIAGRDFSERDSELAPTVAVINETMARHFFGTKNALGQRLARDRNEKPSIEVVGIVADIKYMGVRQEKQDVMFTPYLQDPDSWRQATLLVRTGADPSRVVNSVRETIRGIAPNLPLYDVTTMDRQVEATLVQQRLLAILSSFFGLLALGLSAIGLYGVLSYGVVQRTSEIGVRMALGARRGSILRMILGETAQLLAAGAAAGLAIALLAARGIQSMLYGVTPSDALSLSGASALLIIVALVAGFLPARRASRVDPMVALRDE